MNRKKDVFILISGFLIILLVIISVSYAYFTANITGGEETTTIEVIGGKMSITYDGGSAITVNNILPDNNPFGVKTFTITGFNNTNIAMGYKISLVVESNTFSDEALKYKLMSTNSDNNGIVANEVTELTEIFAGTSTYILGYGKFEVPTEGNKTHTYDLELYFPYQEYDQNIDQQKEFTAYVIVENFNYESIFPYNKEKGVNKPILFTGMTPIKWDENLNEILTTEDDPNWFDYNNKKWANAKTADGSYWVWIPRYAYKTTSGYHSNNAGTIDIKFLKENTIENDTLTMVETSGYDFGVKDTSMHYFLHPAFNVEGTELGFWIAKFEASGTSSNINIFPNEATIKNLSIGELFDAGLNMKTNPKYGWRTSVVDPHMLTSLEWGAVAYLSKTIYGANEQVWINNNQTPITGCGGNSASAASTANCNAYNTDIGQKASTTHNIYGVYDMSGGAYEYVSAYVDNGNSYLNIFGQSILNAGSKYKNIYAMGSSDTRSENYEANKNIYGDAVYETSNGSQDTYSWYGDYSTMPNESVPWFTRGGYNGNASYAGVFAFNVGVGTSSVGFRPAIRIA